MLTTDVLTPEQQQAEWNAVAAEREGGVKPAAEMLPVEPLEKARSEDPAPVDPLKELRDRFEKLEARTRNAEGHIGGLNHNQRLMQETLQAASKAASSVALQQGAAAPTQGQVSEAMRDPEEWETLKNDFPEWSVATEKFLDARLARLKGPSVDPDAIARIVKDQVAGQSAAVRKEIVDASLDAVYPEWQFDVKTAQFGKWLDAQPADVKAMAMSPSIRDAAKMLGLFERAKQASPAADIVAARKQKLANAAGTPRGVRVPPQKAEADMNKEELWNLEVRRRDAARARNS
jgi:hypothetical protein